MLKQKKTELRDPIKVKAAELLSASGVGFGKRSEAIDFIIKDVENFIVAGGYSLKTGIDIEGNQPLKLWLEKWFQKDEGMARALEIALQKS